MARAEVLAHCESRIMEVEQQYQAKLEAIQHQCSRRLEAVRDVLNDRQIVYTYLTHYSIDYEH